MRKISLPTAAIGAI